MRVVLAGGGTAGHVEPALATADALRRSDPGTAVLMLGTERGLESRLVPARGYELALVPAVPLPRRPNAALFRLPGKITAAVSRAVAVIREHRADVVVGFGGYVALPAYLAARRLQIGRAACRESGEVSGGAECGEADVRSAETQDDR